jgi:ABC-type multidrug transport system ATPase subunit
MHGPKLLLLDEPTAGVDPKARREFWDEIHALSAEGLTVMVSTHYMDEAERCHDIAYIAYGKLMARGTADEVIAESGLVTFRAEGQGADRLSRDLPQGPGVADGRSLRRGPACQRDRPRGARSRHRALPQAAAGMDRGPADPGGRLHPTDGSVLG